MAVGALIEACYGRDEGYQHAYESWSRSCPTGTEGSMVVEIGGRLVGVQPMLLQDWVGPESTVRGAVLFGVMVHPGWRRKGLFSALVRACEREAWARGAAFILTMPNERSAPGFSRLGWTDLGDRPLFVKATLPALGSSGSAREVREVPRDVANLVDRHRARFPSLMLARPQAWWEWRYSDRPGRRYAFVEIRDSRGELHAFAVGTVRRINWIPVGFLLDFLADSPEQLPSLFSGLSRIMARKGAPAAFAVVSSREVGDELSSAGFRLVPRRLPLKKFHTVARYRLDVSAGRELPSTVSGWNLTLGDWDNL